EGGAGLVEIALHLLQQMDAGLRALATDARRQVEVLHAQRGFVIGLLARKRQQALLVASQDHRGVLRSEEAGAVRRGAEEWVGGDADEVRQLAAGLLQLLGENRAERGVLDLAG